MLSRLAPTFTGACLASLKKPSTSSGGAANCTTAPGLEKAGAPVRSPSSRLGILFSDQFSVCHRNGSQLVTLHLASDRRRKRYGVDNAQAASIPSEHPMQDLLRGDFDHGYIITVRKRLSYIAPSPLELRENNQERLARDVAYFVDVPGVELNSAVASLLMIIIFWSHPRQTEVTGAAPPDLFKL